jgi:hypothetical protein
MKFLKTFENIIPEYGDDWEIGDIVVAIETKYGFGAKWLHEDYKYEIIDIAENNCIKVKELNHPYDDDPIIDVYFYRNHFITLEEWELSQDINKYNL